MERTSPQKKKNPKNERADIEIRVMKTMVTVKGTKWYVDIISDKRHGRFGGELGSKAFYADMDDFQWINVGNKLDDTSKICLVLEALEANHENDFRISFPFSRIPELVSVMQSVPGLIGRIYGSGEEYFQWEFPNGITLKGTHNAELCDWHMTVSYQNDGKEVQITHMHLNDDKIFEVLIDFQAGRTFFAAKTNLLGKKTLPKMLDKAIYDRMSDRKKSGYSIL